MARDKLNYDKLHFFAMHASLQNKFAKPTNFFSTACFAD